MERSDQENSSGESSSCHSNAGKGLTALLEGHYCLVIQVTIVLDLSEDHVAHVALDCQIELVLPEVFCCSTHPKVWPSGVHLAMQVLVVLNLGEALLKNGRVQEGV